jgi:hypothetical protein
MLVLSLSLPFFLMVIGVINVATKLFLCCSSHFTLMLSLLRAPMDRRRQSGGGEMYCSNATVC